MDQDATDDHLNAQEEPVTKTVSMTKPKTDSSGPSSQRGSALGPPPVPGLPRPGSARTMRGHPSNPRCYAIALDDDQAPHSPPCFALCKTPVGSVSREPRYPWCLLLVRSLLLAPAPSLGCKSPFILVLSGRELGLSPLLPRSRMEFS